MAGLKRRIATLIDGDAMRKSRACRRSERNGMSDTTINPTAAAPETSEMQVERVPEFSQDATLVLVGARGSGKSTLAVIASTALQRGVIDVEVAFQRTHGASTTDYCRSHGVDSCEFQQSKILGEVLNQNPTERILVCSWMTQNVQSLLRKFATTNPVIYVVRDAAAIKSHLCIDEDRMVESLMLRATAFFRDCSNFEFFNYSETAPRQTGTKSSSAAIIPSLTLKRAETHFLKFLSLLYPTCHVPFVGSESPLASVPLEEREFTYISDFALADIMAANPSIENGIRGADAVQVTVHISTADDSIDAWTTLAGTMTEAMAIVRRSTVLPIIYHIKVQEDARAGDWRKYMRLVTHVFRLAPEIVTLDLRLDDSKSRNLVHGQGRARIMGCRELDTQTKAWDDPYWIELYRKAATLSCDSARFVQPALSKHGNYQVTQLKVSLAGLPDAKLPVAAYNSGPTGRVSACFNSLLTVTTAKATENGTNSINHPSISPFQATTALFASFVFDRMNLYVFGAKVDYSMSPVMHNSALAACGIPHKYRPFSCADLRGIQHLVNDPSFGGASIGLPFKVEVIGLTKSLSRHARAIGAVNTLIPIRLLNEDGSVPTGAALLSSISHAGEVKAFYGENTDWIGIKACVQRGLSPANAVRPTTCAVIIGSGGMARAAVYAVLQIGVRNIVMYNRTPDNARKVAAHFQNLFRKEPDLFCDRTEIQFHVLESSEAPWPEGYRAPTILISCVPTHTIGGVPAPNFAAPASWLTSPTGGVVFELGYKTLDTPLLRQARDAAPKGWVAMDGLDLLPEQGFTQFELFTGRRAPRALMRRALFNNYKDESGRCYIPDLQRRLHIMAESIT